MGRRCFSGPAVIMGSSACRHPAMRRLGRVLLRIVAVAAALLLAYLLAACLGGRVIIATEGEGGDADVSVYLLSNGVHTDIAVPLRHEVFDWTRLVDPADTCRDSSSACYVTFGWGDRGFYVETPRWRNLKIGTALRAVSGLGDSVIHATYYAALRETPDSIRLDISRRQYRALAAGILASFRLDDGRAVPVAGAYGDHDAFYAAHGSYSLFRTCNTWTNARLRDGGLAHVLWTPFAGSLMRAHRRPPDAVAD